MTYYKKSKLINVNNSCALDSLVIYLDLLPKNVSNRIINLFDNDLKYLINRLKEHLYLNNNDEELIKRLKNINYYFKKKYNLNDCDYVGLDNILFDNEKLLDTGLIIDTDDNFKKACAQIIHVNNSHYVVKFKFKILNEINIFYIDDLRNDNKIYFNEQIVLMYNYDNCEEINEAFNKLMKMCE